MRYEVFVSLASLLVGACAESGAAPPAAEHIASTTSAAVVSAPWLLSSERAGDPGKSYAVVLPQRSGAPVVASIGQCEIEKVKELFGVFSVTKTRDLPAAQFAVIQGYRHIAAWELACPLDKPDVVREDPNGNGWYAEIVKAADGVPSTFAAIPSRCVKLMKNFRVAERARELRGQNLTGTVLDAVDFTCANERPPGTDTWALDVVFGADAQGLLKVSKGNTSFYVDRVDGESVHDAIWNQTEQAIVKKVGDWLAVPADLREDTQAGEPMPEIAFDLCTGNCGVGRVAWQPAHKRRITTDGVDTLVCLDGSIPTQGGRACPPAPAGSALVLDPRLELDGTSLRRVVSASGSIFPYAFASCAGGDEWNKVLGLPVVSRPSAFLEEIEARYDVTETPARQVPCVRPNSCTVDVAPGADLGSTGVRNDFARKCWRGEDTVELTLAGDAVSQSTLALSPELLPPSVKTVRVTSKKPDAILTASAIACAAGACAEPIAVFLVTGSVTLVVEGLTLVPMTTELKPTVNRSAIDAKNGAVVRLSGVTIDTMASADKTAFYRGISATDATVTGYATTVRAFATAIDANRSKVSLIGESPTAKRDLTTLPRVDVKYDHLNDLTGRRVVSATSYATVRIAGANSSMFLAGMKLSGPVNVLWQGPGSGHEDFVVVDSALGWNPSCSRARTLFGLQSQAVVTMGPGNLRFGAVDVKGVGSLLTCVAPASTSFVDVPIFANIEKPLSRGGCDVRLQFEFEAEKCP